VNLTAIDDIYLAVSDFARSEQFYDAVLKAFGFQKSSRPTSAEAIFGD
jgi:catechol-2,3-dioxygenase